VGFSGEALACIRGERLVFSDLSFAVEPGEALLLTGPNGSGKSSLLRLCAGLIAPAAGRLLWGAAPLDADAHRAQLRYVGHLDAVKPVLSGAENLAFWARLADAPGEVPAALGKVGLARLAELPVRLLSAGQRRRLGLARLALGRSTLWLLDEPTVGLDREGVSLLAALVAAHRAAGGMVIAATHIDAGFPATAELALDRFRGEVAA
jgi:heme exporter protein A